MRTHAFASHTAEEKRRLSDLGHRVEGFLLAAVAILALLHAAGFAWAATAWASLILVAGALLLLLIYPRHPLADWPAIWRDPQQRQHTIMAAAVFLAGLAELAAGQNPSSVWRYVWPGVMLLIGLLFLTHAQHGTGAAVARAVRQHRTLGLTAIVAGLLRVVEVASDSGVLAFLWPIALLAAAGQLLRYHEPEGAFESEHGHDGHPRE